MDQMNRRSLLKGLASVPFLGAFGVSYWIDRKRVKKKIIPEEFKNLYIGTSKRPIKGANNRLKIGIIGVGGRGDYLLRSAGFAHPNWIKSKTQAGKKDPDDTSLEDFLNQEYLHIELASVCDIYDRNLKRGIDISGYNQNSPAQGFIQYQKILEDKSIDAVIIATPDHWHAPMGIDAAQAGKHVYLEKCFAKNDREALALEKSIRDSGIVFQLGHQNHQVVSHINAKEIIKKGLLGDVSVINASTCRYRPGLYKGESMDHKDEIHWELFQMPCENRVAFDAHRFFGWRNYWDYGMGLIGDLFSHEFAAVNQIIGLGIPQSAITLGGIYLWPDQHRETPTVFSIILDYPHKNLVLTYHLTMGSDYSIDRSFIGTDAVMKVGSTVEVIPEANSVKYKRYFDEKVIRPDQALYTFDPAKAGTDAVTTATEAYFSKKGLYYTHIDGKRIDASYLHIKEWIDVIRNGGSTSCGADLGLEEAVTCSMATRSYLEKRKVDWDFSTNKMICL